MLKKIIIIILIVVFFSCKKNNQDDLIPNVPVNITLALNLPEFAALNSVGNFVKISGGYRGIIVYKNSMDLFTAYDLACPHDPSESGAILQPDSSSLVLVDNHCGSKFNLVDGTIIKGPATRSMKPYQTQYDAGNNTLLIFN